MGYRPDDSFFDGKEVSVNRMNKWNLETLTLLDVSDAVRRSGAIDFERYSCCVMTKGNGHSI